MKKLTLCLMGILLLYPGIAGAHNNSISFSEIKIYPDHIQYDLRTILSEFITHAVLADDNGDQKLDEVELQHHRQEIYEYLNQRIKIQGSSPYTLKIDSMTLSESGMPSITFHLIFTPKNRKVGSFTISCKIFEDVQNHRSLAKITSGEETQQFVFTLDNQYERKGAEENQDLSVLDKASGVRKIFITLLILIGMIGSLWFVRRAFRTRSSLQKGQLDVDIITGVDKKN
jgi:hypothetical protein